MIAQAFHSRMQNSLLGSVVALFGFGQLSRPRQGKLKCILLMLIAGGCLLPTDGYSADWYLAAQAAGANSGTSWTDAWSSVTNIKWDSIASGDTLWVDGGDYGASLSVLNKSNVTVKIKSNAMQKAVFTWGQFYNCDGCVMDGLRNSTQYLVFRGTTPIFHGFLLRESENVTLRGIEIDRASYYASDLQQNHGISVSGACDMVVIEYCHIHHTTGDGININTTYPSIRSNAFDSFVLRHNLIKDVGDDGIQAAGNYQVTIEYNYVDKNWFPTYFGGHPDGFQFNPDGHHVIVRNNTVKGFNQNIFIEWAKSEIYVYNNVLIGTQTSGTDRGMNLSARSAFSGNWVLANNTFYNFRTFYAINGGVPSAEYVGNNVFVNCKAIISSDSLSLIDDTNFYWDEPGIQYFDTSGEAIGIPDSRYAGAAVYADPRLKDAANGDFGLLSGSAAIDRGKSLAGFFDDDREGHRRGLAWDAGAYEYPSDRDGLLTSPQNLRFTGSSL
jgi:hypothetical protein